MALDRNEPQGTDRARDTLVAALERSDDWNEACREAALRYAEALLAAGIDPDAAVSDLGAVTGSDDLAASIVYEAHTGKPLPFDLEDGEEDASSDRSTRRTMRWLGVLLVLLGLLLVAPPVFGVYRLVISEKPARITSALVGIVCLYAGIRSILWGIRSFASPDRA